MTENLPVIEGEAPFYVSSIDQHCKTWYKIVGNISTSRQTPLVTIHGGPGMSHHYQLCLVDLVQNYGIPVIFYDQMGAGKSTHLQQKNRDGVFWTPELFCDELDNLLDHLEIHDKYNLLGQSWGGMLAADFASRKPRGLDKLIIANSPASLKLWMEGMLNWLSKFPREMQELIHKHEREGTTNTDEYKAAMQSFYNRHTCQMKPWPTELDEAFASMKEDPTVYQTMYGPNEFDVKGCLRNWSIISDLHKITSSTLVINGRYDSAHDVSVEPFFKNIPKVIWIQFHNSSHLPQFEQRDAFMAIVAEFLMFEDL
ncbi:hypothetical protein M422DRAFT_75868 [Sphaerobolus stellatus SS14]|uniref:AB hydrolase-1 domain-containing protein n=1 Tax=Sphaerobolus stellatus (strain SS14) TaxID=990650 RepID=A0A0C9VMF8_SPHS4|nr:hypothetical protein M422DRAFT_75868 [Sphaerobolus stellatus SS14]